LEAPREGFIGGTIGFVRLFPILEMIQDRILEIDKDKSRGLRDSKAILGR
jgi:hypothetical protein